VSEVAKIIVHERFRFDFGNFFYDIALVKLKTPLELDGIVRKTITLSQYNDGLPGTECWVSGWGEIPNDVVPPTLHRADLKVLPPLQCSFQWSREALVLVLRSRQICALGPNNGDACAGNKNKNL
jgi:hypothetical protein